MCHCDSEDTEVYKNVSSVRKSWVKEKGKQNQTCLEEKRTSLYLMRYRLKKGPFTLLCFEEYSDELSPKFRIIYSHEKLFFFNSSFFAGKFAKINGVQRQTPAVCEIKP